MLSTIPLLMEFHYVYLIRDDSFIYEFELVVGLADPMVLNKSKSIFELLVVVGAALSIHN